MFARLPTGDGHAETETSFNLPRVQKRTRERNSWDKFSQNISIIFIRWTIVVFFFSREERLIEMSFLFYVKRRCQEKNFSFFYLKFLNFISYF